MSVDDWEKRAKENLGAFFVFGAGKGILKDEATCGELKDAIIRIILMLMPTITDGEKP